MIQNFIVRKQSLTFKTKTNLAMISKLKMLFMFCERKVGFYLFRENCSGSDIDHLHSRYTDIILHV